MTLSVKGKGDLTPEQYRVCWERGTERPFTGQFVHHNAQGMYVCVCCESELFESDTKFDAGCGWPSFYQAVADGAIRYLDDQTHGMQRVEVRCGQCDSHLGHVFPDGPEPTGQRYCINSVSLDFKQSL
ncbi:peptide-methionine (R)-S-oxide reductase MsrB [Echinimonas agarilytica]|uniref:Peptide methionine sulfoxide reductase MsrB n=1 Tax=Echinimonas agarilytica TaxID=1215918 RepID=A0AA41W6A5_9GAMM|nr:peptide-methionine (R)-S-oxide reductase MsrB [Echinimonas agarilytica]MCM2679472.1 peptide-methionine (R)-S-oxide reductase MsrB [Echinimonas agarilytica]